MRYVAAYLLATLGGNNNPKSSDIKKILESVGVDYDDAKAQKVISSLSGKNIEDLIEKGKGKLASVPSAGAVAAAPAAAGGAAKKEEAAEKKPEKKEEKKEEEEDEDMGFGLFD